MQLTHCRTLDASKNSLFALPEVLRLLPALRELKVGGNRLDVHSLDELLLPDGPAAGPDAFLSQLQLVDLSENGYSLF
jgi:Leucine-rich repeat (LRR) protein